MSSTAETKQNLAPQKKKFLLHYHLKYSEDHLNWMRFFDQIRITPKVIFLYGNRVCVFVEQKSFDDTNRRWKFFLKTHRRGEKPIGHIRILGWSNDLEQFIRNWFVNIKEFDIQITPDFTQSTINITLGPPPHLRQFLIGKKGRELTMLNTFFDQCTKRENKYNVVIK